MEVRTKIQTSWREGGPKNLGLAGRPTFNFVLDLIQTKAAAAVRPLARNFTHHEIIAAIVRSFLRFLLGSGIQTRFLLFMRRFFIHCVPIS